MWVSASLWASRPFYGPWTSPTHSPLPNGLFTSSMHHPWVSRTPSMGTTCQPHTHIHGNPARLCPWEPRTTPLAIFFCWAFLFFLFSLGSLCVGHLGFLCPRWVGTMNTSPPSPHTTMGFDSMKKQKKLVTREERNKIIVLLLVYSTMYNSD